MKSRSDVGSRTGRRPGFGRTRIYCCALLLVWFALSTLLFILAFTVHYIDKELFRRFSIVVIS